MSDNNRKSRASIFLDQHPNIRRKVVESEDFLSWKTQFQTIEIDGITNYLIGGPIYGDTSTSPDEKQAYKMMNPGGDQLYEEDDLILLWAQENNIVSKEDIDRNLSS
jgi:hypothetical protein